MVNAPAVSPATKAKLDAILEKHVASGLIPASTFAVATADPSAPPLYFKAEGDKVFGQPDKGKINEDTILQLMSMTKLVVSIAALQLVEAGKLSLDDPAVVAKYLPELAELPILTAVEDGKAVTQKATKQTTLRHLLTHTSGSGYDAMVPLLGEWAKLNNAQTVIGADLSVDSFKLPLLFEPGQGWNYSLGLDWGGVLIERVTGQSLEKYFQQHIFKPLGITTLTFNPGAEHFAKLQQVVTHNPTDNSLMIFPGIRDCSGPDAIKGQASGGAGLYGTARDYLRLLQGVMASSKSAGGILTPDSVKLLFTNQLPPGPDGTFQGQYDFARFIPHIDAKLIDGGKLTHSLGGFVCTEECAHGRKKDSLWWEGIYKTFYWLDPATGVTGVFTTQLYAFGVPMEKYDLVFNELERAFYDGLEGK